MVPIIYSIFSTISNNPFSRTKEFQITHYSYLFSSASDKDRNISTSLLLHLLQRFGWCFFSSSTMYLESIELSRSLYLLNFPSLTSSIRFRSIKRLTCQFIEGAEIPNFLTISVCVGYPWSTINRIISRGVSWFNT